MDRGALGQLRRDPPAANSFGRNLIVTGNATAQFIPGLYRVRFPINSGGLLCDLGLSTNPPVAANQSIEFLLTERCFSSGTPHPCDIAYDNGELLPPFGSAVPGWANNGVNEGDYNAFFASNGFFTQAGMGTAAIGMFCDIACDNGDTLTANPGCTNNGVNEGDYNCFFNNFWATACE